MVRPVSSPTCDAICGSTAQCRDERLSISGYWRLGATEEGWRAAKADWNAAAEDVERRAGVA